jgi:hypothetical protein
MFPGQLQNKESRLRYSPMGYIDLSTIVDLLYMVELASSMTTDPHAKHGITLETRLDLNDSMEPTS